MQELALAVVGIAGTLLGVVVTAWFARRNAADARAQEDRRRLRDQRREAVASYAQSMIELRRLALHRWHEAADARDADPAADTDLLPSTDDNRWARNAAWGDFFRVRLVWDDPDLVQTAEVLLRRASDLGEQRDRRAMVAEADAVRAELGTFTDSVRTRLG